MVEDRCQKISLIFPLLDSFKEIRLSSLRDETYDNRESMSTGKKGNTTYMAAPRHISLRGEAGHTQTHFVTPFFATYSIFAQCSG